MSAFRSKNIPNGTKQIGKWFAQQKIRANVFGFCFKSRPWFEFSII